MAKKSKHRQSPRAFDGGKTGRRLRGVPSAASSVNAQLAQYGDTLLARSRYLVQNNPYAANACESFVSNAVGTGIKPSPLISDAQAKEEIQKLWLAWTDQADADGATDFYGLESMIARQMFEAGECFVRIRYRRPTDGLTVPMQLQLHDAEMVPLSKNELAPNGNQIRCGIEFDRIGRRVAYWFYRRHPADVTDMRAEGEQFVRVPASEVIHLYKPIRPGQIRGVPHTAPAVLKLALLDQFDDAELERKKTAALFAGFITRPQATDDPLIMEEVDGEIGIASLEPGTMHVLADGEGVTFSEPADVGGSYEAFQYRTLLAVAAALGVPYSAMTGDLRQTSYGSIRAGLVEFRRRMEQLQHAVFVFQLCRPVWHAWMDQAALSGALSLSDYWARREEYLACKWIPPRWEWIDPKKDREAEILAVNAGFKSRSDVIEAEGYDPEEVDARIKADREREERLGLSFVVEAPGSVRERQDMTEEDRDE